MIQSIFLISGILALGSFLSGCEPESSPLPPNTCPPPSPEPGSFDKLFGRTPKPQVPTLFRSPTCPTGEPVTPFESPKFLSGRPSVKDLERLKQIVESGRVNKDDPALVKQVRTMFLIPEFELEALGRLAERLNSPEMVGRGISIVGHGRQSEGTNSELTLRRAQVLTLLLEGFGVSRSRMTSIGMGKECPVALECGTPEEVQAAKDRNARVEIIMKK